jgi:hypothetical protein
MLIRRRMIPLSVNLPQVCYMQGNGWGNLSSHGVGKVIGAERYRTVMLSIH